MEKHLTPREYQQRHLLELLDHDGPNTALFYGVGGGKTATSLIYASERASRGEVDLVLVITPQEHLMEQFMKCSAKFAGTYVLAERPASFIKFEEREDPRRGVSAKLKAFLDISKGTAMTIAPQILCDHVEEVVRALRTKKILFVLDECHHIHETDDLPDSEIDAEQKAAGTKAAKALSEILNLVQKYEIPRSHFQRIYLSATPYRTDELPVYPKGEIKECSMKLVSLMLNGYAPERIQVDILQSQTDYERVQAIHSRWVADGKPVTHIKLQLGQTISKTNALIDLLNEAFGEGVIVNTRGEAGKAALAKAAELNDLWTKGKIPYSEIPKVYVSVHRMTEGVDIPSICCTYVWGISKTMLPTEQVLGRSMRLRKGFEEHGYPVEWVKVSKFVFCTGMIEEVHLLRYLVRMCCYMESLDLISLLGRMLPEPDGLTSDQRRVLNKTKQELADHLDPAKFSAARAMWGMFIEYWNRCVPMSTANSLTPSKHPAKFVEAACKYYFDKVQGTSADEFEDGVSEEEVLEYFRKGKLPVQQKGKVVGLPPRLTIEDLENSTITEIIERMVPYIQATSGNLTGDKIAEIHRRVLTQLQEVDKTKPASIEEVLDRVKFYRTQKQEWPLLDAETKDLKNVLWSFKDYVKVFPDLACRIVSELSDNGIKADLESMCRTFEDALDSHDQRVVHAAIRKHTKDIQLVANRKTATPLGVYFPNAVKAALAIDPKVFSKLAEVLGEDKALKKLNRLGSMSEDTLRTAYETGGVEGLNQL